MEQGKLFTMTERLEPCHDDPPINEAIYYTGWQILERFTGYVALDTVSPVVDDIHSSTIPEVEGKDNVVPFPNKELGKTAMSDMRSGEW